MKNGTNGGPRQPRGNRHDNRQPAREQAPAKLFYSWEQRNLIYENAMSIVPELAAMGFTRDQLVGSTEACHRLGRAIYDLARARAKVLIAAGVKPADAYKEADDFNRAVQDQQAMRKSG